LPYGQAALSVSRRILGGNLALPFDAVLSWLCCWRNRRQQSIVTKILKEYPKDAHHSDITLIFF